MSSKMNNCGWNGSINQFLSTEQKEWMTSLLNHHTKCMNVSASKSQITAWKNCFNILQKQLMKLGQLFPEAYEWTLIFEYELPRERGRRPDIIILAGPEIFILEFKEYGTPIQAHIDQVAAYARDIRNYHAGSHKAKILPLLILTKFRGKSKVKDEVKICYPNELPEIITNLTNKKNRIPINSINWLHADYSPLPALISAARSIFQNKPLPQIRRAQSVGIPQTIEELINIAKNARDNEQLHLALVTGVPGSGKTLVGLQFVYNDYFTESSEMRTSVLLSGNGPLVRVLQHALGGSAGKVFVQDVHGFLKQYGGNKNLLPEELIWVYDEAQRAWDKDQVLSKRGYQISEPMDFLQLGERMGSWVVIVGLVGEGQEIYYGEESGLEQWNEAILQLKKDWFVHCSPRIAHIFTASQHVHTNERLDLNASLRTHLAENVHEWVASLLTGDIGNSKKLSSTIYNQGFDMYVSRNLDDCKRYVQERYREDEEKRYGLLASSRARNLNQYNIYNDYSHTKNILIGPWYNDKPSSPNSCCQLRDVVTEFDSQGLELDFPIICWGDDLNWNGSKWHLKPQLRSKAHDPRRLRINSYRVLLTRGRDGFIIFVPEQEEMDPTYQVLISGGLKKLDKVLPEKGISNVPILVTGAIIESDNKILITKRMKSDLYSGLWEFPGGKVEYSESPEECLIREIKEELNCEIGIDSLFDVSSYVYSDGGHFVIVFYKCNLISGTPESNKHDEIKWVEIQEMKNYDFIDADKSVVKKLLSIQNKRAS